MVREGFAKVSYHLDILVNKFALIEPSYRVGKKVTYRIRAEVAPLLAAERRQSHSQDDGVAPIRLLELLKPATLAVVANPTDFRAKHRLTARTVALDEMACAAVADLVDATKSKLHEIEGQAAARIAATGSLTTTVSLLLLESSRSSNENL